MIAIIRNRSQESDHVSLYMSEITSRLPRKSYINYKHHAPNNSYHPPPSETKMSGPAPTIIDLKTSFLRQQIRLLSQPLKPSPKYLTSIESEENALRQKSVDAALYKLNGLLRKHIKLSYGPQSLRHVAEQVDALFWNAGEGAAFGEGEVGEEWAERGTDLSEFLSRNFRCLYCIRE